MVFGGSFDENSFQLDGVNVTDNYFNEGFAEPNPDSIEEVEILSLGAPAEYGNLMGAVYNIVTKQGTNAFHGDASYFYQSDGLSGTTPRTSSSRTATTSTPARTIPRSVARGRAATTGRSRPSSAAPSSRTSCGSSAPTVASSTTTRTPA